MAQQVPPILTLAVDDSSTALRVAFCGELDVSCSELFDCLFDLDASGRRTVVLDLADLTFCDVVGINALTGLRDYHVDRGRTVRLVHLAPHVARLMALLEDTERLLPSRRSQALSDWSGSFEQT